MAKFEYKVMILNHQQAMHLEERLNEVAKEGWQAVHFDRPSGGWTIVFERRVSD